MQNTRSAAASPATEVAEAKRIEGNPLRLGILLFILAICVAALGYDFMVAKPGSVAAHKKVEELNQKQNSHTATKTERITPAVVQRELGRKPTRVEKHPTHTIETYCWWGQMPLLSMRRHYMEAVYWGDEKSPRLVALYLNERAPAESLPTILQQKVTLEDLKISPQGSDKDAPVPTLGSAPKANGRANKRGD